MLVVWSGDLLHLSRRDILIRCRQSKLHGLSCGLFLRRGLLYTYAMLSWHVQGDRKRGHRFGLLPLQNGELQ
jgi:hypothetical protein